MKVMPRVACVWLCITFCVLSKPPRVTGNRLPSKPYISGDGFRSMADHVYDETDQSLDYKEVTKGDIVFVKSNKLSAFFSQIHPYIKEKYILVTHNSDAEAPGRFISYLADEKIAVWFGQNPSIKKVEKFVPIPIGVANRYVHNHGNVQNFKPYASHGIEQKRYLLGYNFKANTNPAERSFLLQELTKCGYGYNLCAPQHRVYLNNMSQAKYILSPRGNGLDCHRTWEALIVGAIPIVKSSMLDELFDGLPVLIVESWDMLDESFLDYSYDHIKAGFKREDMRKVTYAYWQERLTRCQDAVRAETKEDEW